MTQSNPPTPQGAGMTANEPTPTQRIVAQMIADRGPLPDHLARSIVDRIRKARADKADAPPSD